MRNYGYDEEIIRIVLDMILAEEVTAYSNCKNKQIYKVTIRGTTFSGHPTRTTLGNTLRSMSFVTFQMFLITDAETAEKFFFSEYDDAFHYTAGDDI